ncbi:unnamed protein product [Rotaria sordida]|uniref:LamG-like jellyroll fold domain-containing protein n=2 Tax=Rotaria sordida TaxID=392033 RepID=A0A819J8G4_9BILA|nr:unnamed protein product [Rotaria sordida]
MFDNQGQLQRFGQKIIIHKRSSVSPTAPRVEKVAHQSRHRSLETKKKGAQGQSTSIVYISVRQPKINQPNNNKSVNPPENLLSLSTILNSRHHRNKFNLPSPNKSASEWSRYMTHPLNETNVSSRLPSLLQNNPAQYVLQISNGNNVITNSQRSNKLDFAREYPNFSNRKQLKNIRNKYRKNCCWSPSCRCIFGCILGILLIGVVVGVTVGVLLSKQNPTITTTATATTITTTTITTASTTTASTTTSTTTTSTTTSATTTSTTTSRTTTSTTTSSTATSTTTSATTTSTSTSSTTTSTTTSVTTTSTTTSATTTSTITSRTTTSTSTSSTTTSTTTSKTTTSTSTSTTTTSTTTSRTTTTTVTTTSTTTTRLNCGQSCLNQSWVDSSGDFVQWPFDGSYIDIMINRNGTPSSNQPAFVTGYFDQACSFNASVKQSIYTSFIPLNNVSFTIEAWIKPTGYPNPTDHSIVGLCPSQSTRRCLHINIRNTKLHFGFFSDDLQGATTISLNQWIHIAFVFDATTKQQTIYLKGVQDGQASASSALLMTSGNFTIGMNEQVNVPNNYYQGYIDHLSVSRRAKSSCEILEIATLAAHFEFDSASSYTDSGPNAVATTYSTTSIISGYKNEAISFSGSSTSYFQAWSFTSLGVSNQAFSITFWIKPQTLSGTLVHLSSSPSGNGSTCFSLLGFASNGAIIAQVLTNNGTIVTTTGPILPVSLSWTLVVQTWSATNGLKLYMNNTLVSSIAASTFKGSEITPNYLTLANCLSGCGVCSNGLIGSLGSFTGAIDDWRIYNRELTSIDVCTLFSAT